MTARIFNVLIGTWLFLSAFMWPHHSAQGFAALVCGALTVLFALLTIYLPSVRYLTAATAVVLFVASLGSAMRLDRTFWHNAVIAIAIFVAALLDPATVGLRRERELYGRI
jgi:hypothetical protein